MNAARNALEKSITLYQLQENELPTSLKYEVPTLTFFQRTIPNRDSVALDTPGVIKRFHAEFTTVKVDERNLNEVYTIISRLLSQQFHKPLNIDLINQFFKKELVKENIPLTFKLILTDHEKRVAAHAITVPVNYYKSSKVVQAIPENELLAGWQQNLFAAIISLLLILLSGGSLFIMGKMIIRQMRLNDFKNDFINNITHELRTPITILKSSTDAMNSFGAADDAEKLARYLKTNAVILHKMDRDIDRILEISKYEQGIIQAHSMPVNLLQLAGEVSNRFNLNPPNAIVINYKLSTETVISDKDILDTILTNLIDNAIKYSQPPVHIEISFQPISNGWQLQVTDNGRGIAGFHLPFIFDKFYRAQSGDVHEVKGYGLGLSYVKQLTTALDGQIHVTSGINEGTTFSIQFNHEQDRLIVG